MGLNKLNIFISILVFTHSFWSGAQGLDFDTAVEEILKRSTTLTIQQATLNAIKARNLPSRFNFLPSISLDGKEPLSNPDFFLSANRQVELSARWNLFRWGSDLMGLFASNSEQAAQQANIGVTYLQAELEAVSTLLLEIKRRMEIRVNEDIVRIRTDLLSIANKRYEKGYLPRQEVEKLMIDLQNAKASLANTEIQEAEARFDLERLLGHSNILVEWPWLSLLSHRAIKVLQLEFKPNERPDWQAAQHKVQMSTYRISQSWRAILPTIDLSVSYGYYSSGYFGSVLGWTGILGFTFPIFDNFLNISKAKEQFYIRSQIEAELVQIERNANSEWSTSRIEFEKALNSALQRDQTLILSRKLYQDNLLRFKAGRISANDLVVDQTRMYDAELLAIDGWSVAHLKFTKVCHSVGRRLKDCIKN